ncbi:MAG: DUF4139 domain-containing protein [Candidatus Omnitrophica bacterium]|nr:DUF4139 domain-containing protein [Candidatus Omnitrophota bacterium]MDE2009045.1 DUF4139 domain-containing protein [Candidatus Omnitrophota bacterium]MDE2214290.1 DUF4139 domain-containing protein [Candidatus Omnitrophota bacterium]MDE2231327.1 DUF4139 domain-containing protein [Candidatus Omnitrophota bacterium]
MKKTVLCSFFLFLSAAGVHANVLTSTVSDQQSVEVTVYNSNLGLVKDIRRLQLPQGQGELRFMDVASGIMPYTVQVQSLTSPGQLTVLEQNYEYDLMNSSKLLDKYVGKNLKIMTVNQMTGQKSIVDAVLLSNNDGPIYKINGEIYLGYPGYQILPQIPENLIAKPTLTWEFDNQNANPQTVQVAYLTDNITWRADYIMVVNHDDTAANINGWVTLDNRSGAAYKNAKLKLVAGQVNRVQSYAMRKMLPMSDMALGAATAPQFQEQPFFEYHLYDLQRPTTIENNQTKQINLLQADHVAINKEYIVHGQQDYFYTNFNGAEPMKTPVDVVLKFKNSKANHMGMPLPAGTVRLYKKDAQGSLEFVGEDSIDHTPKDEDVEIKAGEAFDVVAERQQMDYKLAYRSYETAWEVTIRNHKDNAVKVGVIEPMYGDWQVLESSAPYKKVNANTLRFDVEVPKDQEVKIDYRVRVTTFRG